MNNKYVHEHKERNPKEKTLLINRLKRIEGQVRGIEKMVESDAYCPKILVQSSAVSRAMEAFSKEILLRHIKSCVVSDIREGDDRVVEELVLLIQKMLK